jgi:WD40 repeat protein
LAFSPDGRYIGSASSDKTIKIWAVETGEELATLRDHSSYVFAIAFSPDGRTLATGGDDKTIKLWRLHPPSSQP